MLQPIQRRSDAPTNRGHLEKSDSSQSGAVNMSAKHYSSDKVTLSYKSSTGEELTLKYEHEEYSAFDISLVSNGDKEKWKKIVDSIKDEFERFKAQAIHDLVVGGGEEQVGGVNPTLDLSLDELKLKTDELIEKMPEEWRPDAVSDRILAFTTSFFGQTESEGEDFYNLAKDAILKGFEMAGDELGSLPGDIGEVIKRTREMVLAKLDKWAEEQGIIEAKEVQPQSSDELQAGGIDITA